MKSWYASLLLCLGLLLSGCSTTKYNTPAKIVNFYSVTNQIYRCGQPTTTNQWQYLASIGVKKDIKLNYDSEGSDDVATNYGITVVKVPMPPSSIADWYKEPGTNFAYAVSEIQKSVKANEGVMIHCTHGQDRTGIMVGATEVIIFHVNKATAWHEMIQHGYHPIFIGLDYYWIRHVKN